MQSNGTNKVLSPSAVLRILRRRVVYLLAPALLLTPAVAYYMHRLPRTFRARALVGAEALIPGLPPSNGRLDPATISAQEQVRSIREVILSAPVLNTVRREFFATGSESAAAPGPGLDNLQSKLQIQLDGPDTFYLGFDASDPQVAMQVANRLAGLFVERTSALRGQRIERHDEVLDAEVDRLRKELTASEEGLKAYKERVAQVLPERLATNLKELENLQQHVQTKTDEITEGQARLASINEELNALEKQGVLQEEAPAKTSTETAADELRRKLRELNTKYTPDHPEVKRAAQELHDLEATATPARPVVHQPSPAKMRYIALQAELKSITPKLAIYRDERTSLQAQVKDLDRRINSTPGYEASLSDRTKDTAMLRARYEALFAKQQEQKLNQRSDAADSGFSYKIIEPATLPKDPSSPHAKRIILFAFLASLGIGLMGVFAAERLDTAFETNEDLEAFTTIPVLSTIPVIPTRYVRSKGDRAENGRSTFHIAGDLSLAEKRRFQKHRLTMLSAPGSIAAQQYGILALRVCQWAERTGGHVLLVTSAAGEEGKSMTALNLSLALSANMRGQTLLLDADMRLPQVQERLDLSGEKGLTDLLWANDKEYRSYLSRIGQLDVISGSTVATNPTGLLTAPSTRELLVKMRRDYQLIVLDSPPLLPVPDSHVLAGLADGVLLVARARRTRPELLRRAVDSLGSVNIVGIVLTDVEYSATPYARAYEYQQSRYASRH
jgi:polysaccharide biosynthesis transport protein